MADPLRLIIYTDGGARGNPGPAACAAVVKSADDGETLLERGRYLGRATNNVAEYEAVLLGLDLAAQLKAREVEVRSDSELLVMQVNGRYKVKNERLRVLHGRVVEALGAFSGAEIRHIPRTENVEADRLVGETIREHRAAHGGEGPSGSNRPPAAT